MAAIACNAMGDACSSLGKTCEECTNFFCPPDKPFPIFLSFSWALNGIAPPLGAIFAIVHWDEVCNSPIHFYLLATCFCAICNMCSAAYLYAKVANPPPGKEDASLADLACQIFMYDPMTLLISLGYIATLVITILGGTYVSAATCTASPVFEMAEATVTIMSVFVIGGVAVIFMSLMCDCCRDDRRPRDGARPQRQARPKGCCSDLSMLCLCCGVGRRDARVQPTQQQQGAPPAVSAQRDSYEPRQASNPNGTPQGEKKEETAQEKAAEAAKKIGQTSLNMISKGVASATATKKAKK